MKSSCSIVSTHCCLLAVSNANMLICTVFCYYIAVLTLLPAMKLKIYFKYCQLYFSLTFLMPTTQNCIYCSCSPFLYTLLGLFSSVKGAWSIAATANLVEGILNLIKAGILFLYFTNFFSSWYSVDQFRNSEVLLYSQLTMPEVDQRDHIQGLVVVIQ